MRTLFVFLAALMLFHTAYSAELFGTVDAFSGSASVMDQSGKSVAVAVGQKIFEGQTVNSGPDGEVHLVTEDGGIIAVRPYTVFRIDEYKANGSSTDKIFMSLLKGTVRSITGWIGKHNTSAYQMTTPSATIGIRGTDHETTVIEKGNGDESGTYDNVNEGETVLKTPHGTAEVVPGKFAFAPKGKAVAPYFLTQKPHFLVHRRLKIEERIQQRKEVLRGRLEQMREERIKQPKSIQDNHFKQISGQHGNEYEQLTARRNELREHRLALATQNQQPHRREIERSREQDHGEAKIRTVRHREVVQNNNESEKSKRHNPKRRHSVRD